jgi:hypothetical protein
MNPFLGIWSSGRISEYDLVRKISLVSKVMTAAGSFLLAGFGFGLQPTPKVLIQRRNLNTIQIEG